MVWSLVSCTSSNPLLIVSLWWSKILNRVRISRRVRSCFLDCMILLNSLYKSHCSFFLILFCVWKGIVRTYPEIKHISLVGSLYFIQNLPIKLGLRIWNWLSFFHITRSKITYQVTDWIIDSWSFEWSTLMRNNIFIHVYCSCYWIENISSWKISSHCWLGVMKTVCRNGKFWKDHISSCTPEYNSGSTLRRTIVIGMKNLEVPLISRKPINWVWKKK